MSSTRFFIKNTFIINTGLKLAKNLAKDNQQPEAEQLVFEKVFTFFIYPFAILLAATEKKIIGHMQKKTNKKKNGKETTYPGIDTNIQTIKILSYATFEAQFMKS